MAENEVEESAGILSGDLPPLVGDDWDITLANRHPHGVLGAPQADVLLGAYRVELRVGSSIVGSGVQLFAIGPRGMPLIEALGYSCFLLRALYRMGVPGAARRHREMKERYELELQKGRVDALLAPTKRTPP